MHYSDQEKDEFINFRSRLFNEFFKEYSDRKNARLLDYSGGAVILDYVSAALHVSEIVYSAYKNERILICGRMIMKMQVTPAHAIVRACILLYT